MAVVQRSAANGNWDVAKDQGLRSLSFPITNHNPTPINFSFTDLVLQPVTQAKFATFAALASGIANILNNGLTRPNPAAPTFPNNISIPAGATVTVTVSNIDLSGVAAGVYRFYITMGGDLSGQFIRSADSQAGDSSNDSANIFSLTGGITVGAVTWS